MASVQRRQYSGRALRGSQFHLQNLINDYQEAVEFHGSLRVVAMSWLHSY